MSLRISGGRSGKYAKVSLIPSNVLLEDRLEDWSVRREKLSLPGRGLLLCSNTARMTLSVKQSYDVVSLLNVTQEYIMETPGFLQEVWR